MSHIVLLAVGASLSAQTPDSALLHHLQIENGAEISIHPLTGVPGFIRFNLNTPLELLGASVEEKADAFIEAYSPIFGTDDLTGQLNLLRVEGDQAGGSHFIYRQQFEGLPVFGAELRLHFNALNELSSVNGVFFPNIEVEVLPKISAEKAALIAAEEAAALHGNSPDDWTPTHIELMVFKTGLAQGIEGRFHLAFQVEISDGGSQREFIYLDTEKGSPLERLPGSCDALGRRLYNINTSTQIWVEGDVFPGTLTTWQQSELNAAEDSYYFFKNSFGRTSYDNADAELRTIHAASFLSCPNASWNGSTTNYCDGVGTDDIVGHEWGHAYTEHTSGLIYAWQSGALNESFSDVWGETIDLLSPDGNDNTLRSTCSNAELRWQMGEDAAPFGGSIRDMWIPTCDGDPGKVTDSQYVCSSGDNGGVHTNSGVPNHAFALLTDGGSYNGFAVTGLGLTKAAHIFWQAQTAYLTPTSDFSVMADALEAACDDLLGVNLQGLTINSTPAGPSGQIITAADCQEVADAVDAVELRTDPNTSPEPNCAFTPLLAQSPATPCGVGFTQSLHFSDNFESGLGTWTLTQVPSTPGHWTSRQWQADATPPDGRSGTVAQGPTPNVGDCASDFENGLIRMESPTINIPASATAPVRMRFDHYVSMENGWDGGNIKYSLNAGAWTLLPGSAFTYNAYNRSLISAGGGNDNPLAGQSAFSGSDGGSVAGTWGESQINLSTIGVVPGATLKLRFETSTDGCTGWDGWYIDEVEVYTCEALLPISLQSFRARPQSKAVRLEWATAAESNFAGFELQRSRVASAVFEKIAFIEGKGSPALGNEYHFVDLAVRPGDTWYYRLRLLDLDGQEAFSPIASASLEGEVRLSLLPNPAGDFVTIRLYGKEELPEIRAQLFDAQGKTWRSVDLAKDATLDLSGVPAGIYFLKVSAGGLSFVEKLIRTPAK